ncbi:tyrosinase cofactor [Streptomyces sp. NPDC051677]|uniref:apotyrosinase chaperone MelC1 n=1 Tax=Streptomyces sp. NPDC051677 TaxID=3365669 RepID=UPI0037D56362
MPELSRRRALTATAVVAGVQLAAVPAARAGEHDSHDTHGSHGSPDSFDEVYKGRRIQGRPAAGSGHHHGGGYAVLIDGVELHVMRNADGSWISVVRHYDPAPTPRAAARAAVDELQGARLEPFPAG